jgi:hypothetical protein
LVCIKQDYLSRDGKKVNKSRRRERANEGRKGDEKGFGWIEKRKEIAITKSAELKPCQYLLG